MMCVMHQSCIHNGISLIFKKNLHWSDPLSKQKNMMRARFRPCSVDLKFSIESKSKHILDISIIFYNFSVSLTCTNLNEYSA